MTNKNIIIKKMLNSLKKTLMKANIIDNVGSSFLIQNKGTFSRPTT